MPSIRRNKYGVYYIDAYVKGERRRITLRTKDRRIALHKAETVLNEIDANPQRERLTINDLEKYYIDYSRARVSQGQLLNYKSVLKRLKESFPKSRCDEITFRDAEQYIIKLSNGMSSRGINWHIRTLKTIFNFALEREIVTVNPFAKVKRFSEESIEPKALSISQLLEFFQAVKKYEPAFLPLFLFYLLTGVRLREALRLEWSWIEWESDSIKILGKGRKFRIVPMLPAVRSMLLARRDLPAPFTGIAAPSTISHIFTRLKRKSALHPFKLHDLRKTFGTMLTEYNVSQSYIQKWYGHEDKAVMLKHYIGRSDKDTQGKLAAFERDILSSGIGKLLEKDSA